MGRFLAPWSDASFRHGLSRRVGHTVSRTLRGGHTHGRRWEEDLLSRGETEYRAGYRSLHDRLGVCRIRREAKRQTGARNAGRLRRPRYGHHRRAAAEDPGDESSAHRGRRQDRVRGEVARVISALRHLTVASLLISELESDEFKMAR